MATTKTINELNDASAISGSDYLALSQQGQQEATKATVEDLAAAVGELNEAGALRELVLATSVGKNLIAQTLTEKGAPSTPNDTLLQMADKLRSLDVNGDKLNISSKLYEQPGMENDDTKLFTKLGQTGLGIYAYSGGVQLIKLSDEGTVTILATASVADQTSASEVFSNNTGTKVCVYSSGLSTAFFYDVDVANGTITYDTKQESLDTSSGANVARGLYYLSDDGTRAIINPNGSSYYNLIQVGTGNNVVNNSSFDFNYTGCLQWCEYDQNTIFFERHGSHSSSGPGTNMLKLTVDWTNLTLSFDLITVAMASAKQGVQSDSQQYSSINFDTVNKLAFKVACQSVSTYLANSSYQSNILAFSIAAYALPTMELLDTFYGAIPHIGINGTAPDSAYVSTPCFFVTESSSTLVELSSIACGCIYFNNSTKRFNTDSYTKTKDGFCYVASLVGNGGESGYRYLHPGVLLSDNKLHMYTKTGPEYYLGRLSASTRAFLMSFKDSGNLKTYGTLYRRNTKEVAFYAARIETVLLEAGAYDLNSTIVELEENAGE